MYFSFSLPNDILLQVQLQIHPLLHSRWSCWFLPCWLPPLQSTVRKGPGSWPPSPCWTDMPSRAGISLCSTTSTMLALGKSLLGKADGILMLFPWRCIWKVFRSCSWCRMLWPACRLERVAGSMLFSCHWLLVCFRAKFKVLVITYKAL